MNTKYPDFKQQETGLYDEIRALSEGLDRLDNEGKDTTETIERLGEVLEKFLLFRKQVGKDQSVKKDWRY